MQLFQINQSEDSSKTSLPYFGVKLSCVCNNLFPKGFYHCIKGCIKLDSGSKKTLGFKFSICGQLLHLCTDCEGRLSANHRMSLGRHRTSFY